MSILSEGPFLTRIKQLAVSLVLLASVFLTLAEVRAAEGRGAVRQLSEVKGRKGLRIDIQRVKYRGGASLPAGVMPQEGEVRVPTANPRVIAFVGYDEKGACRLRVFDAKGDPLAVIRCESDVVAIPEGKDIIWVSGKRWSEGVLEHGKGSPLAGLYVYDFRGQKSLSINKEATGGVGQLHALRDGSIILLHSAQDFRGISMFAPVGKVVWQLPLPDPITRMNVFNDGEFIATQSLLLKEGKKKAALYDSRRRVIKEHSGLAEEAPEVMAVTADGTKFILATGHGRRQVLEVFPTGDSSRSVKRIDLDSRLEKLAVDNNLRVLAGQSHDRFRLLDSDGTLLAEQTCETRKDRLDIGKDQRSITWACEGVKTDLEVAGD